MPADGGYGGDGDYTSSYTSSYTDSYTSNYTDSYTSGYDYTGGYEGGYENGYQGTYQGAYQTTYQSTYTTPAFAQIAPTAYCVGTTSRTHVEWSASTGAAYYKVYFMDSSVGALIDNNLSTTELGYNLTTASGLIEGHTYGYTITAFNSSNQAIAYSDNGTWSHTKYGGFTTHPYCTAPGAFQFTVAPQPYCPAANDARILISWSAAAGATYYTITPQSNQRGWYPAINVGNVNSYAYPIPAPITVGEGWEFTVVAHNSSGTPTSINGNSSYYAYGSYWAPTPQCTGPGAFNWAAAPVANCIGTDSYMLVTWYPSSGATWYQLIPQTTNTAKGNNPPGTGWMQPINMGNPANQPGGYKAYYYKIPGLVVTNSESWEFTVNAVNSFGSTGTAGGSTYYHYGWITALNCLPIPGVTFTLTTPNGTYPANSVPAAVNQNASAVLNWSTTNAPTSCTASSSPAQSYWNGAVAASGSQAITTSLAAGPILFSLVCSNTSGPSPTQTIQLTINQYPKPYIQTTGGDVHSNETIYISPP